MKTKLLFLTFLMSFSLIFSQNEQRQKAEKYLLVKGELTFTFQVENDIDVAAFTENLSLVNYDPITKTVKAWANEVQFRDFESQNIAYQVPKSENEVDAALIYDVRPLTDNMRRATLTFPVNVYPTYAEYAQQMQDFEDDYPALVEKISIGATGQNDGKELLFVKISDNIATDEQEPKLMFTSSMHGDEIAGYPMMLTLIDYILTVYSNTGHPDHARVKNLVENTELWINPSANPDGTYFNSANNTSVANSRRANANGHDLNRNYPDNVAGPHDDGNAYQTETLAFMALADANHFVIAANFHGGTELVNYPFDNAFVSQYTHPDGNWFEYTGVEYATHAQTDANAGSTAGAPYNYKASYMTDDDDSNVYPSPGVTHGAEWYRVFGGRQDYMNYYQQCREVTIELSDTKILQESSLDDYWYYNRDALLDFLTQGTYGFRGVVKDASTGNPVEATVTIVGHDAFGSNIVTELPQGDYYRPIATGTYDILFEADCYQSFTLTNQSIINNINNQETKILPDVLLIPTSTIPTGLAASNVSTTSATLSWDDVSGTTYDYRYRQVGSPTWTTTNVSSLSSNLTGLNSLTQYEAQVRSVCVGGVNSAYTSSILFTTLGIPACVGTEITSYPYLEAFDGGIGDWTQAPGSEDDGDWTLNAGATPTNNTGPSDDITGGGNYFYTEAHDISTNNTAIINSPCFDLSSLIEANFSFNYHMYGSTMGSLELEITTDDGVNWINIFNSSGNLGNQWNFQTIDLNSYIGEIVKFRFLGTIGSGGQRRSDIAIDQIKITGPTYCASNGNSTSDEFINRVELNTIDNNNSGPGVTSTGYSDFTLDTALRTNLSATTEYTITITPEWPGTIYSEGYAVWIDYNADGDFLDIDELVWSQAPSQNASVSGTFTVPTDIHYGSTRMRVSMSVFGIPSACESFDYGEVEDYAINLDYDGLLFTNNSWIPNAPSDTTGSDNALILDGTYSINSDIELNDLIVLNGAGIDVAEGESIMLAGDLTNNGELVLNSSSTLYSSLVVSGSVSGDAVYKRHVNINASSGQRDLISAPLTGQTFAAFAAPNANIFSNPVNLTEKLFGPFDKATGTYLTYDTNIPAEASIVLDPGVGYRAASTDNGTFEFEGTVNTGIVGVNVLNSGATFTEWNLIGNPYPSYIKLSDFLTDNIGEFFPTSAAIYGYDGDASDGWKVWNNSYSLANPDAVIAPGQGFLVSSKIGGGTMTFNPNIRTIATGNSLTDDDFIEGRNSSRNEISYLKLDMSSNSEIYSTDLYFTNLASLGLDIGYDATVFNNVAPNYAIYSHLVEENEDKDMSIQSVGLDDLYNDIVIPIGINASQGQQISVSINESTLPDDVDVYLEDNLFNSFTLLNTESYSFTADSNIFGIGRFFLRFESETLSTDDNENDGLTIYTTANPKEIVINGAVLNNTNAILYDIHGRLIVSQSLEQNKNMQTIDVSGLSSGVYIIKIESNRFVKSQKLIIR